MDYIKEKQSNKVDLSGNNTLTLGTSIPSFDDESMDNFIELGRLFKQIHVRLKTTTEISIPKHYE